MNNKNLYFNKLCSIVFFFKQLHSYIKLLFFFRKKSEAAHIIIGGSEL